ncbi:pilus assembly protein [Streptacidiphilus monticola]
MLLLLGIVQFAVAAHAQHIAQAVAVRALAVTRAYQSTARAGYTTGQQGLNRFAGRTLLQPSITVTRTATQASVTVTGTAAEVIPFVHLHVTAHTAGPVERLTPDTEGR